MKKLLTIALMLLAMGGFAQTLEEQYLKYCEADSNKILVGFNYLIDEGEKDTYGFSSWSTRFEVYDPQYEKILPYEEHRHFAPSWTPFEEANIWNWQQQKWINSANRYGYEHQSKDYISCKKIMIPLEPTFKGFVKWKQKRKK